MRLGEILKSAASKKKKIDRPSSTIQASCIVYMAPTYAYDVTGKCPCTAGAGVVT